MKMFEIPQQFPRSLFSVIQLKKILGSGDGLKTIKK